MQVTVKVPGSCGELVQGSEDGRPFLVTFPINRYATATVKGGESSWQGLGEKSVLAVKRTLAYLGAHDFAATIALRSELPPGKGMASSSADIAAAAQAVAVYLGRALMPAEIAAIATGIEPTDGVFFPGVVRLNHITGECLADLGELPPLRLAIFDTGGTVDTIEFHSRCDRYLPPPGHEREIAKAIALLRPPCTAERIAEAATISALANQALLKKPQLPEIIATAKSAGAIGVNVAHSGTVLGVLFAPDASDTLMAACVAKISAAFPHLRYEGTARLIGGGYRIEKNC